MSKKIKSNGKQAFNIPLDEEGRRVIDYLKRHAQKGFRIHARGRGSRKERGGQLDISLEHAEWAAVYVIKPKYNSNDGKQVFNIPLDEEGLQVVDYIKKNSQKGTKIRARGRGSRKYHGRKSHIALADSEWTAVYIRTVAEGIEEARLEEQYAERRAAAREVLEQSIPEAPRRMAEQPHNDGRIYHVRILHEEPEELGNRTEQLEAQIVQLESKLEIITNEAITLKTENSELKKV